MDPHEIWSNLFLIFNTSARELYENEALDDLHRQMRRRAEEMSRSEQRESLSRYVRDVLLGEEALARGEGWETVLSFLDWVDGGME